MSTLLTEAEPRTAERPAERIVETPVSPPTPAVKPPRLVSLDAYRGFIMLAMASGGLAFAQVVSAPVKQNLKIVGGFLMQNQPLGVAACSSSLLPGPKLLSDSPIWSFLAFHTDHVPWIGCSFWDLIQPSFMFMVGVAMPYSFASRQRRGDSSRWIGLHVLVRALFLVLLAVFLSSNGKPQTNWVFTNVLGQIGLGYAFVFLLLGRSLAVQLAAVAAILFGYTLLFDLYPAPGADFPWAQVGVKEGWPHLTGWFAHWDKNSNAAAAFDLWFLNIFPRFKPFVYEDGGYQTLNFVPSMATMILGLMAGEMLRGQRGPWHKLAILVGAGVVCLVLGLLAGELVCPIVKRIWTPSWALFSAAWTFWMLAGFFLVIDVWGYRGWAFPFVVVGMNSIAMYCMAQLMKGWIRSTLEIHLGKQLFEGVYGPIVSSAAVLLVLWLICLWMYRKAIFLRI